MPRKRVAKQKSPSTIVTFRFENRTYEIDTSQRKVYRRFVELETSRAAQIFSVWRGQHA